MSDSSPRVAGIDQADRETRGFGPREEACFRALLPLALEEDLGLIGDATSVALIPNRARGQGWLVAREPGVLAGMAVVERLAAHFELERGFRPLVADGGRVRPGDRLARIEGPVRSLLALERIALNFLQRLSGVATLTDRYVAAVAGSRARILDTRKTTPGWRALEKYAVRQGGGFNHRMGLYDAILIKDNHLAWLESTAVEGDPIAAAIRAGRLAAPAGSLLTIEVDSLDQLARALPHAPDVVLLDNFSPDSARLAVAVRDQIAQAVLLEASGGVTLETAAALAAAGVDRISVGALTHSAPALDVALDFAPPQTVAAAG